MDMNQYLDVFIEEGREHLQNLNTKMLELEKTPKDLAVVNDIFRSAHTIKGMAGSMGYEDMADLTHKMENVLDALRQEKITVTSEMMDVLFESIDHLEEMIEQISQGEPDARNVSETVKKLKAIETGDTTAVQGITKSETSQTLSITLNDFEQTVIDQAQEQGHQIYQLVIRLREDCLLKAARAFMVFSALEELGEVIKSDPDTAEIEEENFDSSFTLVFITQKSPEDIKSRILNISEIDGVDIQDTQGNKGASSPEEDVLKPKEKKDDKVKKAQGAGGGTNKTIRVNLERLDSLLNLFEELIIDRSRLEKISGILAHPELKESVDNITRISNQLQETILNLRMEPIEQVFNRFPRMVRSLSKELNKKVNLIITGASTEIDRTVIDEIGDPIVHLLRNSLDHGVESPEIRQSNGKNPEGDVALRAYHSGNHVTIEIEDDGAGINRDKILLKALEKGLVTDDESQQLTDNDIYNLMFSSGFSTADKVSDISGRGVGLDVVKSKIESLGGLVNVDSTLGKGTKFTIQLPLTLSIINAMMIRVESEIYAVPISSIVETSLLRQIQKRTINQKEVIMFREKVVPIISLRHYLQVPSATEEPGKGAVIITKKGNKFMALIADELLGHQDIVIKPLGSYLKSVKGLSGATILGDGKVALILDCQTIG